MHAATETRIDAVKTASKWAVQKTAEATSYIYLEIKQLIKLLQ